MNNNNTTKEGAVAVQTIGNPTTNRKLRILVAYANH